MELSAVSDQQSAKILFIKFFTETRKLNADARIQKRQFKDEHYLTAQVEIFQGMSRN